MEIFFNLSTKPDPGPLCTWVQLGNEKWGQHQRSNKSGTALQKVDVFKSIELDGPKHPEEAGWCACGAAYNVYDNLWQLERRPASSWWLKITSVILDFWKGKKVATWGTHQPHSCLWKGHGAHHLRIYWTRWLPTNIFMILLSANGTLISDFCLFISTKALFCIPSCVFPNVIHSWWASNSCCSE